VIMDGRTIAEQAATVGAAECIVGAHGAALTNLVFAPRSTTVVELATKNYPLKMFADLAATMDVRFRSIDGLEPALPRWLPHRLAIDADIVVDLDALSRELDDVDVR
jgi:hypothetical protein